MSTIASPRPLLTVAEVARRLRVSEKTVRRRIDAGEIPALRVGGLIRVDALELAEWLYRDPADNSSPSESSEVRGAPPVFASSHRAAVEATPHLEDQ